MQEQDLERLVDVITQAVRGRLGIGAAAPASQQVCASSERCSVGAAGGCPDCSARVRNLMDAGAHRIGSSPISGGPAAHPSISGGVASLIDHTLLKPEATPDEVRTLCEEARTYSFASVCVNAAWVPLCHSLLQGSAVKTVAVVGFPLGATLASAKAYEACEAVRNGADEIDMVLNIGALKAGDYRLVYDDIRAVVEACRPAPLKVILETSKLTDEEKVAGCAISKAAGAAFVKTSTGFGGGGATVDDIALMRKVVGPALGVKASGGVRTRADADALVAAGATRIGASASVAIATGQASSGKGY